MRRPHHRFFHFWWRVGRWQEDGSIRPPMSDGWGSSIRSCLIVLSQRLNQQDPDATAQAFSGPMKARTDHPQAKSFNKPTDHEIIQTLSLDCQPGPGKPLPWRI
ncbi:MAG TPA: hypothetical protein DDW77_10085, partial [Verrucomicrobiales bacterium]|nr:hypothetical protein [Verrucomicrobiales bacterium]